MSDTERTVVSHEIIHNREYISYSDGSQWTRKLHRTTRQPVGDWTLVESPPVESSAPALQLSLVAQTQTAGPKHWSLFSHIPDEAGLGKGQVWQVKGDAEFMRHQHAPEIDILNSASFAWHQVLNANMTAAQFAKVDEIARAEPPPYAENQAAVTENCQGWTIRVLWHLVGEGIVEETAVVMLQQYMDPIA